MDDIDKSGYSTPRKLGYIDILQKVYGNSWITPDVLKSGIIKDELKNSKTKKNFVIKKLKERYLNLEESPDLERSFFSTDDELHSSSVGKENCEYPSTSNADTNKSNLKLIKSSTHKRILFLNDSDSDNSNEKEYEDKFSNNVNRDILDNNAGEEDIYIKSTHSNSILESSDKEIEHSQILNSSSSDIESVSAKETNFAINEPVIYVSDSDSETKLNKSFDDLNITHENEMFKNGICKNKKGESSDNFNEINVELTPIKFKTKCKSKDSFIADSSSSLSSDDSFANTPANYNRLDSLIKKSGSKKNFENSSNLRRNLQKRINLYYSSDEDDGLTNATICQVDEDEEIDELTKNIDSIKFLDDCNKRKVNNINQNKKTLTFLESLSDNVDNAFCHKDALPYLKNFKRTRDKLARTLFNMYNEKVFDNKLTSDMPIIWCNSLRTTGGLCQSKRIYKNNEVCYVCTIKLSTKVVDRPHRLRDTLIHELCHAANFEIDKVRDAKHSLKWKYWTRKAEKCFPELPPINTLHNYTIEYNFAYKCTKCIAMVYRHKNSFKDKYCHCGGIFKCQKRKSDGTYEDYDVKKTPTAFAKFIQENYKHVSTPDSTHKERMKELSNLYAQRKIFFKNTDTS